MSAGAAAPERGALLRPRLKLTAAQWTDRQCALDYDESGKIDVNNVLAILDPYGVSYSHVAAR